MTAVLTRAEGGASGEDPSHSGSGSNLDSGQGQGLASSPEGAIAIDIARRALPLAAVPVGLSGVVAGWNGAASAGFAVGLVLANLLVSAWLLARAAQISPAMLMVAALFGYPVRLALIAAAVLAVADASWVVPTALGVSLIVSHLGLLAWELRYVSASLAFPGLKPARRRPVSKEIATP